MKYKIPFILGLAILIFIAFSPSLQNRIDIWDDEVHLSTNKDVRSLTTEGIRKIFTHTVNKTYIPLTTLSFAVEYHFFKYRPVVYHFTNIVLHWIVTVLIFLIGLRLGLSPTGSFLAALLFGIHPLRVESVAWVTERKDVLYAVFYLLAVYAHCRYVQSRSKGFFVVAMVCGLLSILAKAMALSLPLILLICDGFLKREFKPGVWFEKLFHLAYIVPIAWLTYSLNARMSIQNGGEAFLTWIWTLVFYLRKFFWPFELIPIYVLPKPVALSNPNYVVVIAGLIILAALIWQWRRNPWVIFAFLYYFFSIFFLLRYDDMADVNIVADRFMYLPSLGLCFLIGKMAQDFFQKKGTPAMKTAVIVGIGAIVFGLSLKTFQQCKIWKDDFTLWSYVLAEDPNSFRAHFSLGQEFYQRGDSESAMQHYREALRLNPTYAKALNNVGEMLYSQGNRQEAIPYFERAVFYQPDYMEARNNYGSLLLQQGKTPEARVQIEEAIRLDPDSPFGYMNLGDMYYKQENFPAAQEQYEKALQVSPDDARVFNRLGAVYLRREDFKNAVNYFKEALIFNPQDQNAGHNLAVARRYLEKQGQGK